jgi:hypothetical protein
MKGIDSSILVTQFAKQCDGGDMMNDNS